MINVFPHHIGDREISAETMLASYEIGSEELSLIRGYGQIVLPRIEEYISLFYGWMKTIPEFKQFFSDPEKLQQVQEMQRSYWKEFFRGQVTEAYIESRRQVGDTHARFGLSLLAYFAGVNRSLIIFSEQLYDNSLSETVYSDTIFAMTKLLHLDTSIVVNTYTQRANRIITEQHRTLLEMSTPVTAVWEDILMLPIVGIIDSKRAQDIMHAMLHKIAETQAKAIILDISGVGVVDTAVANHLIKITKATKLMGCECTVSGVSPAIAQTIVELGIDVGDMKTTATLRDALGAAFYATGFRIERTEDHHW